MILDVFEDGVPPRFRLHAESAPALAGVGGLGRNRATGWSATDFHASSIGAAFWNQSRKFRSRTLSTRNVKIDGQSYSVVFEEHEHAQGAAARDNNMRAAVIHVIADAAVSVMVIVGLLLARAFGWLWMDPLAGIAGACVIASWSFGLIRDTGAILLDMNPDRRMADNLRQTIEGEGDALSDLHLWRLGPGHLGAIMSVCTRDRPRSGLLPKQAGALPLALASDNRDPQCLNDVNAKLVQHGRPDILWVIRGYCDAGLLCL